MGCVSGGCARMSASLAPKISFVSHRRFTDDKLDYTDLSGLLSPFQIEKFSYFYGFFDSNGDGHVDMDDMEGLEHRSWAEALAPSRMNVTHCSRSARLHMWARLCRGSAGIDDFPIWVQLLPRALFNIIVAREGSNVISKSSLRNFYERFTGLSGQELEKVTENGYKNASASGDYELNFDSYKLLFSNFLLGKTIYGPGKYIFGCFDNRDMDETYKVIYDNV